ncbi:MAG: hemerythrin domain-containing protein [Ignavibacteriaceae bacterium]|nr:hemerythrin domain-containing protein [Ignavibacteriaceae bacterium]
MKRHPALHTLSHDHHQGLILAQQLKKGAPQYKGMPSTLDGKKDYAISFYKTEVVKHFEDEEKILFPSIFNRNDETDRLVKEIISEHRKIESLIDDLRRKNDVADLLDELGVLLDNHIRKEERILFPKIEEILSDEELANIRDRLLLSRKNKN